MPIRDVAAQCASLANDYGASHGSNAPSSFVLALFVGDPMGSGVEVDDETTLVDEDTGVESVVANGYVRATVANNGTNFPAADATTGILTTPTISFPVSTAAYPDTVTHWLLLDASGGTAGWDSGALGASDQLVVEGAGVTPALSLTIFYSSV